MTRDKCWPKPGKDLAIFWLKLSKHVTEKELKMKDVLYVLKKENVQIDEELQSELEKLFPELKF